MDNEHLPLARLEQEDGAVARILQRAGGDLAAIRTRAPQTLPDKAIDLVDETSWRVLPALHLARMI